MSTSSRQPYRYRLDRNVHMFGTFVLGFVLHNPSTADEVADDPTVRRCMAFADALGAQRLVIVNAWAGRATDPADLWRLADPVGPENDAAIADVADEVAASGGFMIAGWGRISAPAARRAEALARLIAVEALIRDATCPLQALACNGDGSPQHPLYIPAGVRPTPWSGAAAYRDALGAERAAHRPKTASRETAADALRKRLRGLLDKTVANGCTQAEALAAAAKAAELMREHGLAEAELHVTEQVAAGTPRPDTWRQPLAGTIAVCTNTAVMAGEAGYHFVGREPGPTIAVYLRTVTFRAVEGEIRQFKAGPLYRARRNDRTRRAALADFRLGMVAALCTRLREIFGPQVDSKLRDEAKTALARLHPSSVPVRRFEPKRVRNSGALADGYLAGQGVHLSHGVATPSAPARLQGTAA